MTQKQSTLKGKPGWILQEALGTYGWYMIMLGVIAGALFLLFSSSKLTQTQQSLTTMTMNLQGVYSAQGSYTGLSNTVALKAGVVPKDFSKGGNLLTPWGGAITLAAGSDPSTFTISMAGIREEDCMKLGTYRLDMWVGVSINGTRLDEDSGVSGASNACSGNSNTVIYTAR